MVISNPRPVDFIPGTRRTRRPRVGIGSSGLALVEAHFLVDGHTHQVGRVAVVKYMRRAGGGEAIADDMPPATRAAALLIEHANQRRDNGLPLPCACRECEHFRGVIRCFSSRDGKTLIIEASP